MKEAQVEPTFAPIRIPAGWIVTSNSFFEADPVIREGVFVNRDLFSEDLLVIEEAMLVDGQQWVARPDGLLIDVGWYPGEQADGNYRVTVLRGDWDHIIDSLESRDRGDVIARVEHWLFRR